MEKVLLNAEIFEDKIGIQVDKAKATLKIDVVDAIKKCIILRMLLTLMILINKLTE